MPEATSTSATGWYQSTASPNTGTAIIAATEAATFAEAAHMRPPSR